MHFSIPDTQEFNDGNGSYVGYNIHINGMYHCTVRYKQLHCLNEQLKKIHSLNNVPEFPPKKFLPLSSNQLEERRTLLERYIQSVGQTPHLMNSELFNGFLFSAQQESFHENPQEVSLDVFLMNGYKITINANTNERTDQILEKVCTFINLPANYMYYFSLFLICKEEDGDITIVRKLQNFESPYISKKSYPHSYRIVLRKSYWDPAYDTEIMTDRVGLNLLYTQTVSDVELGWIFCSKEISSQLATLQATGAKKEYLELALTLKYYGYMQFRPCICDYPYPGSSVIVSAGHRELNLRVKLDNGEVKEGCFKVTRMRCWRITTHNERIEDGERKDPVMELAFEYLMARDKLQWVTITSDQAILISVCLQSIVDELMLKKTGLKINQRNEENKVDLDMFSYMRRDGSSQRICLSQSSSSLCDGVNDNTPKSPVKLNESSLSMRRLSEKLTGVGSKHCMNKSQPLVENDAFEGIGDDDLVSSSSDRCQDFGLFKT
ncbi:sorting nexin-17-like isoform X2 [Lycorma delicatula]|uniref:sorting nexin-17-like isoform X2 n=2 Tax=Lycorma delicatula TaxID=130591 RepID=UPI003F50FCCD